MKLRLILYILGIVLTTLGAVYAGICHYWMTAMAAIMVLMAFAWAIWHMIHRQIGQLEQIVRSLQVGDLNLKIRPAYHDARLEQLASDLDEGVQALHRRMSENEAKVQLYADRLEQAETQAWQKLIRVLTHEIMNSITPIISLSETLCPPQSEEGGEEWMQDPSRMRKIARGLEIINRRSHGLLEFVQNYRQLTRIAVPVKSLFSAKEMLGDLRGLYRNPNIQFRLTNPELKLYADRAQLEQVLINLIKNAIEAVGGDNKGWIEVEVKELKNNFVRISVSDNGPGIAPEVQERIFIPFFTTKPQGSGIGLALSRQVIQLHHGQLSVQSALQRGTTFTIMLPMEKGQRDTSTEK